MKKHEKTEVYRVLRQDIMLFLQKFTDFIIRDQVVCEGFAISEPARIPIFDDTDTETVRINFLTHTP